jgi:hypothetical protein
MEVLQAQTTSDALSVQYAFAQYMEAKANFEYAVVMTAKTTPLDVVDRIIDDGVVWHNESERLLGLLGPAIKVARKEAYQQARRKPTEEKPTSAN